MATVRTVTVKTSGGTYTSLNAAFAAESKGLVALDRQLDIICDAFHDTTACSTGSGWTTDATRFVRVAAATGAENLGIKDQGYRLTGNTSRAILGYVQHIRFENIQLNYNTNSHLYQDNSTATSALDIRFIGCYMNNGGTGNSFATTIAHTGGTIAFINCVLPMVGTGSAISNNTASATLYTYNCTILGRVVSAAGTTFIAKNTLFAPPSTNPSLLTYPTTTTTITNCAFKDTPSAGTGTGNYYGTSGGGNRFGQTFTFVDSGAGDYHLASNDAGALNYGTDLSGDATFPFSTDIDGQTRSGSWDIGADEYIPANQTAAPISDISAGTWTPSTGQTLYGVLDETTASDADYIGCTSAGTFEVKLAPLSQPVAGTCTLRYKAYSSSGNNLAMALVDGTTVRQTWNHTPPAATTTLYEQTITTPGDIVDWTNLRVRGTSS